MYKVRFNTTNFKSSNRKDWERQLMNDYAVAINGKEFDCEDDRALLQRLHFIDHSMHDNLFTIEEYSSYHDDENNYIDLESDKYGNRRLELSMYGIPQGYIDFEKVLEEVKEYGRADIEFSRFYDLRQGNFFNGCYIEVIRV